MKILATALRVFWVVALVLASSVGTASDPSSFNAPLGNQYVATGAFGIHHYVKVVDSLTFAGTVDIPGLDYSTGIDVADLDGDGDNDFVVCDGNSPVAKVYVYENDGRGTYQPHEIATVGVWGYLSYCTSLRIDDFNGDGVGDIVVGDERNFEGITVFFLASPSELLWSVLLDTSWAYSPGLWGVAAGDFDGDQMSDVVVLGYSPPEAYLYSGDGFGNFSAPTFLFDLGVDVSITFPTGIARLDVEGDGDLDLVVGGGTDGTHYLYTNNGAGGFTPAAGPIFDAGTFTSIDDWDVDGDGDDDLVVAAYEQGGPGRVYLVENEGGVLAAPVQKGVIGGEGFAIGAPRIPFAPPECGNGILEEGEDCDDGNDLPGDGCEPDCTLPAIPAVSGIGLIAGVLAMLLGGAALAGRRRD